ncbi:hypothetical protein [uncultured Nostoc sp.]
MAFLNLEVPQAIAYQRKNQPSVRIKTIAIPIIQPLDYFSNLLGFD